MPYKECKLLIKKTYIMKLTKFSMKKMSIAEMNAIKAGSGNSSSTGGSCYCSGNDRDTSGGDSDW